MENLAELNRAHSLSKGKNIGLCFEYGQVHNQINAETAADYAHVAIKTARRWLNMEQEPSQAVKELLLLKATGRVMPYSRQWQGCYFFDNKLITDSGKSSLPAEIDYLCMLQNQNARLLQELEQLKREKARLASIAPCHNMPNF